METNLSIYKILILGDSGVGKSSILIRYVDDNFHESYISTIGVDFRTKTISVNNKLIKLNIWDTTGQERFRSVTQSYYKNASGIILCYDVTCYESFDNIKCWLSEIKKRADLDTDVIIIGNKSDLTAKKVVDFNEVKAFCDELNLKCFETSASKNSNVNYVFAEFAKMIYERRHKMQIVDSQFITLVNSNKKQSSCCCSSLFKDKYRSIN